MQTQLEKLEKKLDMAKVELRRMTSHWRQEWRDEIIKWSDQIKIKMFSSITGGDKYETFGWVNCPTDSGHDYCLSTRNLETLLPRGESEGYSVLTIAHAVKYHEYCARKYLAKVPVNLVVDIFRHFVLAFGGEFLDDSEDVQNNTINAGTGRRFRQTFSAVVVGRRRK